MFKWSVRWHLKFVLAFVERMILLLEDEDSQKYEYFRGELVAYKTIQLFIKETLKLL